MPHQSRSKEQINDIAKGGYVLKRTDGTPDVIFIATGSEVALAVGAAEILAAESVAARVVSMPSTNQFDLQSDDYREEVLPKSVTARVAIEAGVTVGGARFVGTQGAVICMNCFGRSAPAPQLFDHYGLSVDNAASVARQVISAN